MKGKSKGRSASDGSFDKGNFAPRPSRQAVGLRSASEVMVSAPLLVSGKLPPPLAPVAPSRPRAIFFVCAFIRFAFFFGILLASVIVLRKRIDRWNPMHLGILLLGALLSFLSTHVHTILSCCCMLHFDGVRHFREFKPLSI